MDPEAQIVEEKNMHPSGDETTPEVDVATEVKQDKDSGDQSDKDLGPGSDPKRSTAGQSSDIKQEVDSREESCSMTEKVSGGGEAKPPKSLDLGSTGEALVGPGSEPLVAHDGATSQVSEVGQPSEANNTRRRGLGFDLNEENCSEETDGHVIIDLNDAGEGSSVDASPWQSVRLRVDLNSVPEYRQYRRRRSTSRSSSSSSMQSNSERNIDLNSSGGDSVILLFGTRLDPNPNNAAPQPETASRTGWGFGSWYGPPGATSPYMLPPFNGSDSDGAGPSENFFNENGRKRKEPEGGWEDFPWRYKHHGNSD